MSVFFRKIVKKHNIKRKFIIRIAYFVMYIFMRTIKCDFLELYRQHQFEFSFLDRLQLAKYEHRYHHNTVNLKTLFVIYKTNVQCKICYVFRFINNLNLLFCSAYSSNLRIPSGRFKVHIKHSFGFCTLLSQESRVNKNAFQKLYLMLLFQLQISLANCVLP